MSVEMKRSRIQIALGNEKADLVLKNAKIINVFTKEIIHGDIAIHKELIVGIGTYSGKEEIDVSGKYVCPGLIDSHVHIESAMVTPGEFAKAIVPWGTTTIIADPHEIANVCGINGIHYMLNQTKNIPLNVYFMIPSCVPATPFENNGAELCAEAMELLIHNDRVLGLGEVMDTPSILSGNEAMLRKIDLFDFAIIDGHAPSLTGHALNAYRASGVMTDHECTTTKEAVERLRLGMYIQIREGTAAKNLENIVTGLIQEEIGFDRCVLCTDDKHLEDIRQNGHISFSVKKAIACGVDPIDAICMATINAAQCYKLKKVGAIAPGYSADLILLDDLSLFHIHSVLYRGKIVVSANTSVQIDEIPEDKNVRNTVRIPQITKENLEIKIEGDMATTIRIVPHELITKKERVKVTAREGLFIADATHSKIAVIERHKALGKIGLGIVSHFGIQQGAIASTVAHDSHNLIVIGDNDEDMLLAINEIRKESGGLTIVSMGAVLETLPLRIAGLMSDETADAVEDKLKKMIDKAYALGVFRDIDPFITLSFLALPVIPEIRVTDEGLFDVNEGRFLKI